MVSARAEIEAVVNGEVTQLRLIYDGNPQISIVVQRNGKTWTPIWYILEGNRRTLPSCFGLNEECWRAIGHFEALHPGNGMAYLEVDESQVRALTDALSYYELAGYGGLDWPPESQDERDHVATIKFVHEKVGRVLSSLEASSIPLDTTDFEPDAQPGDIPF